jgi:hypothetical protein
MKKVFWVALVLCMGLVALAGSASAGDLWDGCPDGQFVLEYGCVLCLPGYSHQATGATSEHGYACYACLPNKLAISPVRPPMCVQPVQPLQPKASASSHSKDSRKAGEVRESRSRRPQ